MAWHPTTGRRGETWPPRMDGAEASAAPAVASDRLLVAAVLVLAGLGIGNLLSLDETSLALRQLLYVAAGLAAMFFVARWRGGERRLLGRTVYGIAVFLLAVVTAAGIHVNGARRWLAVGSVAFQPSELAKLGLVLVLAEVLGGETARRHRLLVALGLAGVPVALTLIEPDLSTAALLGMATLGSLVLARVRLTHTLAVVAGAATLLVPAEHLLRPYQAARLHAFLSGGDPLSTGWSTLQAHIAIASGGLSGASILPRRLLATFLPARESDLAFASLVEQRGLLAGVAVLVAAAVLVWRLVVLAGRARSLEGALVAAGLALLTGVEVLVNVGGNLGVLPLAGVPCPFLSLGGTAAVAHLLALGMVLGEAREGEARRLWRPPRWRRRRPRLSVSGAGALAAGLGVLGLLAAQLQAGEGTVLQAAALREATRAVRLPAPRGPIVDRHGVVLAADTGDRRVLVVPDLAARTPGNLSRLAALLGEPPADLRRRLDTPPADGGVAVVAADRLPASAAAPIEAAQLPGVFVVDAGDRRYPYGPLLAPVLGFAGVATPQDVADLGPLPPGEIVGRTGVERSYDRVLRGRDGAQRVLVDAHGTVVGLGPRTAPLPGQTVQLSLDLGLQQTAAAALAGALRGVPGQPRGDEGAVVVMDPRDGALLALVSLPAYDDNVLGPPVDVAALARAAAEPGDPFLNHATQVALPPGSTFKLVVAAADMATGVVPPDLVVPTGGSFHFGGAVFHNWTNLPPQNLPQAIAWSNDVYFYKLALALGPERIAAVARELGVGERTGVDLPAEAAGFVGTPHTVAARGETWYPGSTVILGIGQGYVTATPLQVARWTAAVATGKLVTPHLGLVTSGAGATAAEVTSPAPRPLPFADQLNPVRTGMRQAVLEGTGTQLRDLGLDAGSKTGTAEDPGTPSHGADAWFTAAAPLSDPRIVVTVMVRGGGEGFYTAEPVARAVLAYWAAHRDAIAATTPPPLVAAAPLATPHRVAAAPSPAAPRRTAVVVAPKAVRGGSPVPPLVPAVVGPTVGRQHRRPRTRPGRTPAESVRARWGRRRRSPGVGRAVPRPPRRRRSGAARRDGR